MTWQSRLQAALAEAVAHLTPEERAYRASCSGRATCHLDEPGPVLRVTWGHDQDGDPIDLVYIERAWLFADGDSDVTMAMGWIDTTIPDTVPDHRNDQ